MEHTEEQDFEVRQLNIDDLDAIVEVDFKVGKVGIRRYPYWRTKIEEVEGTSPSCSLVAEYDGKVVGFILGTVSGWEFGIPNTVGWIDVIGIDPAYHHRGVATTLFKAIIEEFKKEGAQHVYTLVQWDDWDLMSFFKAVGFSRGELINLEYRIP